MNYKAYNNMIISHKFKTCRKKQLPKKDTTNCEFNLYYYKYLLINSKCFSNQQNHLPTDYYLIQLCILLIFFFFAASKDYL